MGICESNENLLESYNDRIAGASWSLAGPPVARGQPEHGASLSTLGECYWNPMNVLVPGHGASLSTGPAWARGQPGHLRRMLLESYENPENPIRILLESYENPMGILLESYGNLRIL